MYSTFHRSSDSRRFAAFSFSIGGDVYTVESADEIFINQVLDAHWGVLNDDALGVLNLVAGVFS
ncbi:hypothetical protein ACS0TY_013846 [Phlomoides rotata]